MIKSTVHTAVPSAMTAAKLFPAGIFAGDIVETTIRAAIGACLHGIEFLETLHPLIPATDTPYQTNIPCKMSAVDTNGLSVDQAVGDFFPCGQQDTLKRRA
jgi:hypothetical protein